MNPINRRHFIKHSLATAASALATTSLCPLRSPAGEPTQVASARAASDRVLLGRTGIRASFLAQGTGMHGGGRASDHTRMGQEAFTRLIRHGFEEGINLWDMADLYGTHPFLRKAMQGIPREKYVTLSKLWTREESWNKPSGGAKEEVDRFRGELGIEVLDICLIHCMVNADWTDTQKRVRDELSDLKAQGTVRAVGVSCHDFGAMKVAASDPWVDVLLARINNKGGREYMMDGTVAEVSNVLKTARANGKAVIGMKIFAEGKLTKPEEKDASLKYVLGSDLVDAITIGMRKIEEIDDSLARINRAWRA